MVKLEIFRTIKTKARVCTSVAQLMPNDTTTLESFGKLLGPRNFCLMKYRKEIFV